MKTALFVLVIILLLSLAGNVYFFKKEKAYKEQSDSYFAEIEQRIREHVAWTELAQARIDSLRSKRHSDSLFFRVREIASNAEIRRHKKTIAELRPLVAELDSLPDLEEYLKDGIKTLVIEQDSTIALQDSLILDLTASKNNLEKSFTAEIDQKDLQLQATSQTSDLWREAAENAEKQTRKEKRRTKFFKILSGVITLGAIFLIAK